MHELAATALSVSLRESLYVYPFIETGHVLAILIFVGLIAIFDLRMMEIALTTTPAALVSRRLLPWTAASFVFLIITGGLLFIAVPERTYHSVWFRLKIILLLWGAANAFYYHRRLARGMAPDRHARWAGGFSLLTWIAVVIASRMIAYNWFDCTPSLTGAMKWLAGCP